jgi:hypothetical protein
LIRKKEINTILDSQNGKVYMLNLSSIFCYKLLPSELMVQYTEGQEKAHFEGNALRNFRKLYNSGIIQKILNYHAHGAKKPLEISFRGNSVDTCTLLTSVAAQHWRKRVEEENTLPKGFTRSPKLRATNYAFSRGFDPTEAATYFSLKGGNVTVLPQGAEAIAAYARENLEQLQLPELHDMLNI